MNKLLLIVAGGFLGAGKTTALISLAQALERTGKRSAVIMNDQGEQLVDTALGRARQLPVAEVTGGCFCCRFDDLVSATVGLAERSAVDVVLAEAVGSCADLTATVIRPLRGYFGERFQVAPLTVFVEPRRIRELRAPEHAGGLISYLFEMQLQDAQLLVLTKLDMLRTGERA